MLWTPIGACEGVRQSIKQWGSTLDSDAGSEARKEGVLDFSVLWSGSSQKLVLLGEYAVALADLLLRPQWAASMAHPADIGPREMSPFVSH